VGTTGAKYKLTGEVLRDKESIYNFLLDNSKGIILILSRRGKILFANKTILDNFGYSEEEIAGKSITSFLTKDSIMRALYALAQEFLGLPQPEMEVRAKTKSGEIRYLKVAKGSCPIYEEGKLIGVMVSASDITDPKKAEKELGESEQRFKELWNNAPVAYHILDAKGIITNVNQTEAKMLGYAKEEMAGKSIFEFILPEQKEEAKKRFQQKMSGRHVPKASNKIYVKKDGSKIYVDIDEVLERDYDDKIIGVRTTMIDITKQKETDAGLKTSVELYRDLVEGAGVAILVNDREGSSKYVNEKYAEIFGYSVEEIKKQSIRSIVYPDDVEKVLAYHTRQIQGGETHSKYEFRGVKKDGTVIYLEVASIALEEGENIVGTRSYLWDITERKTTEMELKNVLEMLRKAMGATVQAISRLVEMRDPYTAGHQRRVADLARAIAKEMGLSNDQIDGIRVTALIHDIGKISVPAEILSKPGRLTEVEFDMIKTHPQCGYDILRSIEFPWPVAQIVLQHHERIDGSGYPSGISDKEITQEAKILAVADVVEAMISHRPYRPALGINKALEEISKNSGVLYDPKVVEVCTNLFVQKGFNFRELKNLSVLPY